MTRWLLCAVVVAACAKPADKPRSGPIRLDIEVNGYDRDTACKPTAIELRVKSEPGVRVTIAGVSGTTGGKGVWLARVPSATLEALHAKKQKRVAVNASKGERTGTSSYSLHLIGDPTWVRRYPKGLDKLELSKTGWDSAYLACHVERATATAGTVTIKGSLLHWVVPYDELGNHVSFDANADADDAPTARVSMTVSDGKRSHTSHAKIPIAAEQYKAFLATLKQRAGKASPAAPAYRRGKGLHPLLYITGQDRIDASLAAGKRPDQLALIAVSKDRYEHKGSCVYRSAKGRQEVGLLRVNPTISVYSTRTGKRVAKRSFIGLAPSCKKSVTSSHAPGSNAAGKLDSVLGALPKRAIKAWLAKLAR